MFCQDRKSLETGLTVLLICDTNQDVLLTSNRLKMTEGHRFSKYLEWGTASPALSPITFSRSSENVLLPVSSVQNQVLALILKHMKIPVRPKSVCV